MELAVILASMLSTFVVLVILGACRIAAEAEHPDTRQPKRHRAKRYAMHRAHVYRLWVTRGAHWGDVAGACSASCNAEPYNHAGRLYGNATDCGCLAPLACNLAAARSSLEGRMPC